MRLAFFWALSCLFMIVFLEFHETNPNVQIDKNFRIMVFINYPLFWPLAAYRVLVRVIYPTGGPVPPTVKLEPGAKVTALRRAFRRHRSGLGRCYSNIRPPERTYRPACRTCDPASSAVELLPVRLW